MKFKINFQKHDFYIFAVLNAIISIALMFWIISTGYDINGLLKISINKFENLKILKLFSYISNSLIVIFFIFYAYFLRYKLKAGCLFFIIWIIIYVVISFIPYLYKFNTLNIFQQISGVIITICALLCVLYLIYLFVNLIVKRKINKYELNQNMTSRKRR
ncbi:hypothetical protein [Mycoplasmopsis cricetuli]|uniref:hypothetical protein n=1 Tax=Mycoplasmopsis cricetuli TaxID=171283 RepID=UPI0004701CE2|nr:hypothetical protein [Mycoplasmopsis cricetuli]